MSWHVSVVISRAAGGRHRRSVGGVVFAFEAVVLIPPSLAQEWVFAWVFKDEGSGGRGGWRQALASVGKGWVTSSTCNDVTRRAKALVLNDARRRQVAAETKQVGGVLVVGSALANAIG